MGKRKYESEPESVKKVKSSDHSELPDDESEQPQISQQPENKKGYQNHNFDMKHFRKDLSLKQGQTMVLTQFLNVCLNPDKDIDYISEYLKVGGNSHEILRQISQDNKKNLTLATPAFHLFHLIIVKVQSSLPHLITITEEACRYFLNTFIPTIEIMISESSSPRHRKIILKLLTSIVTLNSDLGVEILNQVPLTPKHLQYILEKPNYKEKDNVRTTFVHFMTSFIIEGHLPLIKALLEKQGLLGLVIPGLIYDEAEAVLIFLNILKKNVIENPLISKTLKLKTFNQQVLHNMFRVFSWKGPPDINAGEKNNLRPEIIGLLTDIMLTLFTSHRLGLYFIDISLGTSDANKNLNLYKSLLSLKRPWENEKEAEVILHIVHKCPDLHRAVINVVEQSFQPQHSPAWERTLDFVIKLIDVMKPENMFNRVTNLTPVQTANFVRFVTLPVPLLKHIQTSIGNDNTISLYSAKVLVKMLSMLRRYVQILDNGDNQTGVMELKNKLEYFLPKHVPPPTAVVTLIRDVIEGSNNDGNIQDNQLQKPEDSEALLILVELLLLYHDLHPTFFESLEGNIDMKRILDYSVKLTSPKISLLKFKIVSLWLTLDNSAVSINNPMFKELFRIMLDVYTNDDGDTWIEAQGILQEFFRNTTIFEGDEDEIHIVLHTLRNVKVEPVALVGDVVEYAITHKKEHTEFVRDQIVHFEISDMNKEENLETLFKDLMRNKNNDENVFVQNTVPSPFIVSSLQYTLSNKEAKKSLKNFLSLYVANLLHSNFSPEMTEILMEDSKLDVRNYVASWMAEPMLLPERIVGRDNVLYNLSRSLIGNESLHLKDIFLCVEESSEEEKDLVISNVPFKITQTIESSELIVWSRYLVFCLVKLTQMNKLTDVSEEKLEAYFACIIKISEKKHMLRICREIISCIFRNPHVLQIYSPVDSDKSESNIYATKFLLNVLIQYSVIVKYLDERQNLLQPYKLKNYKEVIKALVKIKKRKQIKCDHTTDALQVVGFLQKDDFLILDHIFNADLNTIINDDREHSLLSDVVCIIIEKYSKSIKSDLPQELLQKTLHMYSELLKNSVVATNLNQIEEALISYFENKPHHVKYVTEEAFRAFFHTNTVRKSTSRLASVIIKFHEKFFDIFQEEIKRAEILGQRELTLPLGNALLERNVLSSNNKEYLINIYEEYKSNINKYLEKPHKAGQLYLTNWKFIRKLIIECMDISTCRKLFTKSYKFETVDPGHTNIFQMVFIKLCIFDKELKKDFLVNYLISMLNLTTTAIKDKVDPDLLIKNVSNMSQVISICSSISEFQVENKKDFSKITEGSVWQNFCKAVLKDSLKVKTANQTVQTGPTLLHLLTKLIQLLYPDEHADIVTLFDMVTSHSEFLNVMLSHHSPGIKSRLLQILYVMISINKSVMKSQQIPVYLSAYGATRSPCDRLILSILYLYENCALPVNEYKPYVWGDSAANYYAVRKNRSSSLWGHPTPNQVLNLFDKDLVERTVRNFPVTEKLEYKYELPDISVEDKEENNSITNILKEINDANVYSVNDNEKEVQMFLKKSRIDKVLSVFKEKDMTGLSHTDSDSEIYDPLFVFSLLSHLLAPGSVASCFKLLRIGLLSVPVMALSSHCSLMRSAAYHVLHRFCLLLDTETKHKNDKLFLTDFVSTLRLSLSTAISAAANGSQFPDVKNPRLPAVGALYLARALMVSTAPSDPLYKPVNNFFIAKQLVDLTTVPDFLSLFHDSDVESGERRLWILDVIRDGTKTMTDVHVLFKGMCLKMVMDFYSTTLCDRRTKERILETLSSIISVPRAFEILIEGYGLLSWLHCVAKHLAKDEKSVAVEMFDLIKNMLNSLRILSFNKFMNNNFNNAKIEEAVYDFKTDKDVEFKILLVVNELSRHLGGLELGDVHQYLTIYELVSKKALKILSNRQVLNLIHKCGALLNAGECLELLSRAVTAGPTILGSVQIENLDSAFIDNRIVKDLASLVHTYLA